MRHPLVSYGADDKLIQSDHIRFRLEEPDGSPTMELLMQPGESVTVSLVTELPRGATKAQIFLEVKQPE